ncbi:sensor histidine kinase [Candidatus Peregrinibacteria bacterium]|nr:sensor histidine kinase [Candidatus Peregrinibacteria bacterium]
MKIHIPNSVWLGNIDPFLKGFYPLKPNELKITFNKKWISIHPMVLSMIAALGLQIHASKIECEKLEAKSKHYLERMKLFHFLRVKSGISVKEHEAAGRFVPLTQIKDSKSLTKFVTEVTPLLHLEPKHAEPIRYIMSELIRNVLEHSLSKDGAIVCAQYYKKSNTIRIGIADTGIGIWKSISQSYKPKNDLEAIGMALTPGITGTTIKEGGTERNAGAGLFFIKSIASVNNDFFVIYSGKALYKLLKRTGKKIKLHVDPFDDRHSRRDDLPSWQGTVVGIDLSLDKTQEFALLLQLLNKTLREAIKERKKARYKKPQFI